MKILYLCNGNTCRSQIAAAYTRKHYPQHQVFSAGTPRPGAQWEVREIHWKTRAVAWEIGLELTDTPKPWQDYSNNDFDLVVAFSDRAAKSVPWRAIYVPIDDPMPEGQRWEFIRIRDGVVMEVDKLLCQSQT